ncbi:unnamed protein product [Linum tenue]|uniref:S-protein homolog n=1 Tax=Linum tenue TaxID=586396 RepID=A0AAV0KZ14_9ROSI|nr:unnamed protein product [Linum tenue]
MAQLSIQELTVHVANKLSNKILLVHCRSKDDDLGALVVEIGAEMSWRFEVNAMGSTLFWCNLAVEDKRLSFEAYGGEGEPYYGYFNVYDDGVYGKNFVTNKKLMGRWRRIWVP